MAKVTYNMGFKFYDLLTEVNVVKDLLISGYEVKRLSKNCYSVIGVDEAWRDRIERLANKFWHF